MNFQAVAKQTGAMLLIAGTCIGGGMLGLPVSTAEMGFFPSIASMFFTCLMMTATGLLLAEVTLAMDKEIHVMTMASRLLGSWAKVVSLVLFVFVSYASLSAYTAAIGAQMITVLPQISVETGYLLFLGLFGGVIALKGAWVEGVNSALFGGMLIAYFCLLAIGGDDVSMHHLQQANWTKAYTGAPMFLTAFSFQSFLIPTIASYLNYDSKLIRRVIIGGVLITLMFYLVWQWLVMGTVPMNGPNGLQIALEKGEPATAYFSQAVNSRLVANIAEFFAFFAAATSFIGMGLGLYHFFSDSLHIEKKGKGIPFLALLVLVPTYLFTSQLERVFTIAMETTGGLGDTIINGIFPVLMVWVLRRSKGGGALLTLLRSNAVLVLIFGFYASVFLYELFHLIQS